MDINLLKQNAKKIIIFVTVAVLFLAGLLYYYNNKRESTLISDTDNQDKVVQQENPNSWMDKIRQEEAISSQGEFSLLDDSDKIIFNNSPELYPTAKAQYEKNLKVAQDNIAKGGDDDFMVTNYNNAALYNNLLGDYKTALEIYQKSLSVDYNLRITWMGLGDLLVNMRAYKSAEVAYQKVIDLNPYDSLSYVKMINLYKTSGEPEKAASVFEQGLKETEKNVEGNTVLLDAYAEWLKETEKYTEAISVYEDLKNKQPNNKDAIDRKIANIKKLMQ